MRQLNRLSALKQEHRMDRNYLKGIYRDQINAILVLQDELLTNFATLLEQSC